MASKALPCPNVLRQLLRYEPEAGKLFWKERGPEWFSGWGRGKQKDLDPRWRSKRWNKRYAGQEAGCLDVQSGYVSVRLFDIKQYAHRIIWTMTSGEIPQGMEIDHQNGVRSDNKIKNLRLVSSEQNSKNQRGRENTSGFTGVSWNGQRQKWQATIYSSGKSYHLGFFSDVHEAALARKAGEKAHGFHDKHGCKQKPQYRAA